jgi:hypothetical protein
LNNVKIGDVAISGRRSGFYSSGVRFITQSKWSHCFFIMTDVAEERAVLEADLKCQVIPFEREYVENNNDYYQIYELVQATEREKSKAANEVYKEFAGEVYGFLQIPWFIWDAICERLGLNAGKNWFPNGAICSEVLFAYLISVNDTYREAFKHLEDLNRVSPADIAKVILDRPDQFKLRLVRE